MKSGIRQYLKFALLLKSINSYSKFSHEQSFLKEFDLLYKKYGYTLDDKGQMIFEESLKDIEILNNIGFPECKRYDCHGYFKYKRLDVTRQLGNSRVCVNIRHIGGMRMVLELINKNRAFFNNKIYRFKFFNKEQAAARRDTLIFYCDNNSCAENLCKFLREKLVDCLKYWGELPPSSSHPKGVGWMTQHCRDYPRMTPGAYLSTIVSVCMKSAYHFKKCNFPEGSVENTHTMIRITAELLNKFFNYDIENAPHILNNKPSSDYMYECLKHLFPVSRKSGLHPDCAVLDKMFLHIKEKYRMIPKIFWHKNNLRCSCCNKSVKERYNCCLCGYLACSNCLFKGQGLFSTIPDMPSDYINKNGVTVCKRCQDLMKHSKNSIFITRKISSFLS
ncbi:MAG: hypothetical protein GY750_09420 [Lentisphaerae bacterium]|nr:hypothetical protein [Lentisphaerota bacterium]MCP4101631.1 hypothetical protein [Lentisphaerota bacterium]